LRSEKEGVGRGHRHGDSFVRKRPEEQPVGAQPLELRTHGAVSDEDEPGIQSVRAHRPPDGLDDRETLLSRQAAGIENQRTLPLAAPGLPPDERGAIRREPLDVDPASPHAQALPVAAREQQITRGFGRHEQRIA
jgi:hypothetical protein